MAELSNIKRCASAWYKLIYASLDGILVAFFILSSVAVALAAQFNQPL